MPCLIVLYNSHVQLSWPAIMFNNNLNFPVVDCGSISVDAPLMVNQTDTTFNSTATFTCQTGYNISADISRTCQANGTYSNSNPVCTRKSRVKGRICL